MAVLSPNVQIRHADERGLTELRWLHSRHSFSFGRYYDPQNMGYRALRVLNDDVIEPASGFGEHGHENMEIITWVIDGVLRHRDSTGTDGEIRPGEVQVMTAGRGIRHSEVNPSDTDPVHLLQIWIEPNELGLAPTYSQKAYSAGGRSNRWQVLASPDGREDSLVIHQNSVIRVADLKRGKSIDLRLENTRHGYLHVAFGAIQVDETTLAGGDAMTFAGAASLNLSASQDSQLLFFDLA